MNRAALGAVFWMSLTTATFASNESEKVYAGIVAIMVYPKEVVSNMVNACSKRFPDLALELSVSRQRWIDNNELEFQELAERTKEARGKRHDFDRFATDAFKATVENFDVEIAKGGTGECRKTIDWLNSNEYAKTIRALGLVGR